MAGGGGYPNVGSCAGVKGGFVLSRASLPRAGCTETGSHRVQTVPPKQLPSVYLETPRTLALSSTPVCPAPTHSFLVCLFFGGCVIFLDRGAEELAP